VDEATAEQQVGPGDFGVGGSFAVRLPGEPICEGGVTAREEAEVSFEEIFTHWI
jgi:hypothetical protein